MTDKKMPGEAATPPSEVAEAAQMTAGYSRHQATTEGDDHNSSEPFGPPADFNPWEALMDLEAGLVQVEGRWVCCLADRTFTSARTNGGLGLLPADRDGAEAVWLAWRAVRPHATAPTSHRMSSVWFARASLAISVRPPRGREDSWRAWTWKRSPLGLLEPGLVFDALDADEAVWNVFASRKQAVA